MKRLTSTHLAGAVAQPLDHLGLGAHLVLNEVLSLQGKSAATRVLVAKALRCRWAWVRVAAGTLLLQAGGGPRFEIARETFLEVVGLVGQAVHRLQLVEAELLQGQRQLKSVQSVAWEGGGKNVQQLARGVVVAWPADQHAAKRSSKAELAGTGLSASLQVSRRLT